MCIWRNKNIYHDFVYLYVKMVNECDTYICMHTRNVYAIAKLLLDGFLMLTKKNVK